MREGKILQRLFTVCMMFLLVFVMAQTAQAGTDVTETETSATQTETSATQTKNSATKKTGWVGDKYYRNGKAVNGWQKIDGYTYYFKKYKVQRNTIAGTKATGQYYVGPDGVRVNDPTMKRVVKFVLANSKTSDSRYKRLQSCCAALRKYPYFHMSNRVPKASEIYTYADYMLINHKGNCYRYGVTMTYVAIALGFKARVVAGGESQWRYPVCLYRHGWCEIKTSQGWKIWDLSLQRKSSRNLLNILRKDYPYYLRAAYLYNCTISKGKITWKRKSTSWANTSITRMY